MIQDFFDIIENAMKNLGKSKTRTILTLLGVIIGIAAIVSLISVGNGLNRAVESQLQELGSNTIFVIPGSSMSFGSVKLTNADLSFMKNTRGVTDVAPIYATNAVMEFNGKKVNVQVSAVDATNADVFQGTSTFQVAEGRMLSSNESGSIIIGNTLANDFFDKKIEIRKQVLINGQIYKVIGILKPQQQAFGGGFNGSGSTFMSLEAFKRIEPNPFPGIIFVKTSGKDNVEDAADEIKEYMTDKYGEGSVTVSSSEKILEQVNQILSLITIFLAGVGAISIIVGSFGIANAMITTVLERTREIGVMKALGASNSKVLAMFLVEAGFIGAIGGIIGVGLGYLLAIIVAFIGQLSGFALSASISWELSLGALIFSMLVGMGSGFFPALRAANMDPVNALRYE